jgi:glycosyltransferase involved in cell wall biosynthesis
LKILTLSDIKSGGGAAVATNRIATAIRTEGNQVSSITSDGKQNHSQFQEALFLGKKQQLADSLFKNILPRQLVDSMRNREWRRQLDLLLQKQRPDMINLHNLHSADLPIGLVQTALHHAPVVWTLHDCWSFLGTYYPRHSPTSDAETMSEILAFWDFVNMGKADYKLSAVTPSVWMREQATASQWEGVLVEAIHNPVPDSYFEHRDQRSCKQALGLDLNKPVVLSVAGNLEEERKGGPILKEVLASHLSDKAQFLLIGSGCFDSDGCSKVKNLGFVRDEVTLQIAYHAADLLLHPAPIDNLPNTVAESMSCGTPVLAFYTGGLPEMVIPDKSGWLVKEINALSIIAQLDSVLNSKDYQNLRESTKENAHNLFNSQIIACKYMDHFQAALASV